METRNRREFLAGVLSSLGVISVSLWTPPKAFAFLGARALHRRGFPDYLYAWGDNYNTCLGVSGGAIVSSPTKLSSAINWAVLAPSKTATFMIRSLDKSLWVVGSDLYNVGVLGTGTLGAVISSPTQIGTGTWTHVASNGMTSLGVKQDGTLWAWGSNQYQCLGYNATSWAQATPLLIASAAVGKMDMHNDFGNLVNSSGQLYSWGSNPSCQLGVGNTNNPSSPVLTATATTTWLRAAAGYDHSGGIKSDGTLWTWGTRDSGGLGNGSGASGVISTPIKIGALTTWADLSMGYRFTIARKSDGTMAGWGLNTFGATGVNKAAGTNNSSPIAISGTNWATASCGYDHFLALKGDGKLWACGSSAYGKLGTGSDTLNTSTPVAIGSATWTAISAGEYHSLGVRTDGTLWAWGYNNNYQLGQSNATNTSSPVQIGVSTTWSRVAAGRFGSIGINNGVLFAWGDLSEWYTSGLQNSSSPIQIGSDTDWAEIRAGRVTYLVQKTNGNIYGFGVNGMDTQTQVENGNDPAYTLGQLQLETLASTPVQVGTGTTWSYVCVGSTASFGIKTDGTLWQWGWIIFEYMAHYSPCRYSTPVQVGVATNWQKVASYGGINLGLQSNGSIFGWGSGQPGIGTNVNSTPAGDSSTPVAITSPAAGWVDIASSGDCGFGVATDGNLYSWGLNEPALGNTTSLGSDTPVNTGTGTLWRKVAAGASHALGIKSTGTLWAWGDNPNGPLGTSNTTTMTTPVQVGTATDWRIVAANSLKTMATKGS